MIRGYEHRFTVRELGVQLELVLDGRYRRYHDVLLFDLQVAT